MKRFLTFGYLLFLLIGNSTGTTLTVQNTNNTGAGSLRQLIATAGVGDTILISNNFGTQINLTSPITIDKSLIIFCPNSNFIALNNPSGDAFAITLTSGDLVGISGLKFYNSLIGVSYHGSGNLHLINCVFESNTAHAIYHDGDNLNIFASSFMSNSHSGGSGAAIYSAGGYFQAYNCTFGSNTSGGNGGAIYSSALSTSEIVNCTFRNNSCSSSFGSAIYGDNGITIANSLFEGNSTSGGVLRGDITLLNGNIIDNTTNSIFTITGINQLNISPGSTATPTQYGNGQYAYPPSTSSSAMVDGGYNQYLTYSEKRDVRGAPRILQGNFIDSMDVGSFEFSPWVVTKNTAGGAASLNGVISAINASVSSGPFYISFDLTDPSSPTEIYAPLSIQKQMLIDGFSQVGSVEGRGFDAGTLKVVIRNTGTPSNYFSFESTANSSEIKGVHLSGNNTSFDGITMNNSFNISVKQCIIEGFDAGILVNDGSSHMIGGDEFTDKNFIYNNTNGIILNGSFTTSHTVRHNFIGMDETFNAIGNSQRGIYLEYCSSSLLKSNILCKNNIGIELYSSSGNYIESNFIGTGHNGNESFIGNTNYGILMGSSSLYNYIWDWNVISGNGTGIKLGANSEATTVQQNFIGTIFGGNNSLPNSSDGVFIEYGSKNNLIGTSYAGNIICGNGGNGITVDGSNTEIYSNFIGLAINESNIIGNGNHGVFLKGSAEKTKIGDGSLGGRNRIVGSVSGNGVSLDSGVDSIWIRGNQFIQNGGEAIQMTGSSNSGITPPYIYDVKYCSNSAIVYYYFTTPTTTSGEYFLDFYSADTLNTDANGGEANEHWGYAYYSGLSPAQYVQDSFTIYGISSGVSVNATLTDYFRNETSKFSNNFHIKPNVSVSVLSYPTTEMCISNITSGVPYTAFAGGTFSSTNENVFFWNNSTGEIDLEATGVGTFQIQYMYLEGSCSQSAYQEIKILEGPQAPVFNTEEIGTIFCQGQEMPDVVLSSPDSTSAFSTIYKIYKESGGGTTSILHEGGNTYSGLSSDELGLHTIYATATIGNCESGWQSYSYGIRTSPNAPTLFTSTITYCEGDPLPQFELTKDSLTQQEWIRYNIDGTSEDMTNENPSASILKEIEYLEVRSVAGTCKSDPLVLNMDYYGPRTMHTMDDTTICINNEFTVHATGGSEYMWIMPDGSKLEGQASFSAKPLETVTYSVTIGSEYYSMNENIMKYCYVDDSVTVTVNNDISCNELRFYTAITPNNDGDNEFWFIENINNNTPNTVSILNRWGQVVWETQNYDNKDVRWSGLGIDGSILPNGTYFYSVSTETETFTGWVEIIR